jgi:biopolymer transport protein ExbB
MDAIREFIDKGGIFMYPIILGALWAFIMIVERALFFFQTGSRLTRQSREFSHLLTAEGVESASRYIGSQTGILKTIVAVALDNKELPVARIEEKMSVAVTKGLPEYQKYLNLIASLAGLMPMLGLLGTISGMISIFKVIALQGTGDAQAMADGISEALLTTEAGLVAAIPIILGHVLLTDRLHKISSKAKEICLTTIDYLKDNHA